MKDAEGVQFSKVKSIWNDIISSFCLLSYKKAIHLASIHRFFSLLWQDWGLKMVGIQLSYFLTYEVAYRQSTTEFIVKTQSAKLQKPIPENG